MPNINLIFVRFNRMLAVGAGAMVVATAMRVANAIPYVVAAAPGLLSLVDLPLTIPQGALARPS